MRRMFLGAQQKLPGTKETIQIQIGGIALLNVNAKLSVGTKEFGKRGIDVSFPLDTQERNTMDALYMRLNTTSLGRHGVQQKYIQGTVLIFTVTGVIVPKIAQLKRLLRNLNV